jgi:hypothetical protein
MLPSAPLNDSPKRGAGWRHDCGDGNEMAVWAGWINMQVFQAELQIGLRGLDYMLAA